MTAETTQSTPQSLFQRNIEAFINFAKQKGAEIKDDGEVYLEYHELTSRIQREIERAGGKEEPVDPERLWRSLIIEHIKPLRLGAVQREYLSVIKASGGEAIAWKLFECLHYNAYPYYYFMRRLSNLEEKGLVELLYGGARGGLSVKLTRLGEEVASVED